MTKQRTAARTSPSALQQLRDTITVDALVFEIEELLARAVRDPSEWKTWKPVLAQARISRAETQHRGTSESPERQLKNIARYCVEYEFRPEEMCFEAQSGHLTDKRPRKQFESCRQRIEDGSLEVVAVLTYNIDRFTRDRYIGERWLKTLKDRGVDLHEVDEMEAPLPLHRREEDYARAFLGAWRESVRTSKRVRDVQHELIKEGQLLSRVDHYGHRPVWEERQGRRHQVAGIVDEAEAEVLREATRRLHAGASLYSIVTDYNDRGVRGRLGGMFTHNSLGTLLKSPRLIGMQRLGGQVVSAPIEPIISVEDWETNCELLAVSKEKKRRVKYPLSGLGVCAACDSPIIASGGYYKCSRKHLRNQRRFCTVCEMVNGRCMCSGRATAADGHVHAHRKIETLERFVVEVALAAHDAARAAREAEGALARMTDDSARRTQCQERLDALHKERRGLARQERQGILTEAEAADELRDIIAQTSAVGEEMTQLRKRRQGEFTVSPAELREQAQSGGVEFVRLLVSRVIDHYVVHPSGGTRVYEGIELVFSEGYAPPDEAVEALRAELSAQHARDHRFGVERPGQATGEDEELALMLWKQNMTTVQIAQQFNDWKRPTPRPAASGSWTETSVRRVVKRACDRRGIQYVTRTRSLIKYPQETRDIIHELCREKRGWDAIVSDLERLGITPWDDKPWTPKRLRACYAAECARRGEKPRGRRPGLPQEMRRLIRVRKRVQGQTYAQIAEWLNSTDVQRPNRKPWDRKAVEYLVSQEDARLAATNDAEAAALTSAPAA